MLGAREQARFGAWRLGGLPQVVEYAQLVLEEILTAVAEGYRSFRKGGIEIGGVLFGTGDKHLVRILAHRPIPCEHASGPSFSLSEKDEKELAALLGSTSSDPLLRDLVPVGWYHSHTRSGISITEDDLEIHNRYFPEPWQIALVLQAEPSKPARIGIFVRSADGALPRGGIAGRVAADLGVFVRSADGVLPREPVYVVDEAGPPGLPAAEQEPEETQPPAPPVAPEPGPGWSPSFTTLDQSFGAGAGRGLWKWLVPGAGAVVLGAAFFAVGQWQVPPEYRQAATERWQVVKDYWRRPSAAEAAPPLSLHVAESGPDLLVRWNTAAEPVREASSGLLEIMEGDVKAEFPLEETDLLRGSTSYRRHSGDVRVRLTIQRAGAEPVVETARFVGRPETHSAHGEVPVFDALREEVEQFRVALQLQEQEAESLDRTLASLRAIAAATPRQAPKPQAAPPTVTQKTPSLAQKPPASAPGAVILEQQPRAAPSAVAARAQASRAPGEPAYSGPSSGRLIWTGYLEKNAVVTIEGRRPSSGNLSGQLPGVPVRVVVHPAELSATGLTVFSADPEHSGRTVTEAPGPQNAWNRTSYRWDPERARGTAVAEAPEETNGWDRVTLRATERPLSAIVVEWERTPPVAATAP